MVPGGPWPATGFIREASTQKFFDGLQVTSKGGPALNVQMYKLIVGTRKKNN